MEFYLIFSVVVIGIAYAVRRLTDPARTLRKREAALRALAEMDEPRKEDP